MTRGAAPRRRVERAVSLASGKPLDHIDGERHCAHPQCSARLSRYNPNATCATHGGWADDKAVRRRTASST